ncbi:hypothetical protein T492DRAFT_846955 [Pavlovales sp. CCMP2436]|nr:hypothetical protein T492DRAFT_846955 [Pavlovales sp. CCMP2436]
MKPGRLVVAASLVGAASYLVSVANAAPRFDNACLMSGVASTGPRFDNAALRTLRVSADFHGPARQIIGSHFVRTRPHSLSAPQVVASSPAALELVGLANLDEEMLARVLSGNELLPGSEPAAHCYCGHQFGAFAGQLGDGAAMYLGEVFSPTLGRWELQLKGAGPTPFSRSSDGRKVLRSSVREFLASEAVHCLGVPTTRAASLVTSASTVVRDVRYDGNARPEACAVVARVARTFVRFGSFEICRPTDPQTGRTGPNARTAGGAGESPARSEPLVLELVDYVAESFLGLVDSAPGSQERALALLESVCASTAELLARWQGLGFTHGVLNTDNMGILSDTIDYGPYGFMGHFDKLFTPNSSDNSGRYCYDRQPAAVEWNVAKLGQTLALAGALDAAAATACTDSFRAAYERAHLAIFRYS